MKGLFVLLACILVSSTGFSQTPVNMAAQANYTYTETFADYQNWVFSTSPANGTFVSGTGSAAWRGNDVGGTGTVPNGTKITNSTYVFQTGTSGGIYQVADKMVLLTTSTADNTTATAMDLFVNFTGLNAGTLSFDWTSITNLTGNRKSSLKVYTSTDGINFTELTNAAVLNVTNGSPTSGSISFVNLPSSLNNSATAQIRFYLYNGTGGTSGNRPRLSIDNVKVTAVGSTACTTPTAQPTGLSLTPAYSSISGSFSAAVPAAQGYIVIASRNSSLSSLPVDGSLYNSGDDVGDGTVISYGSATSFNYTSLTPSTQYYFFVFAMNNLCSGGPLYLTTSPLIGSTTTLSANAPCAAPSPQPSNLVLDNITINSIHGSFAASSSPNADHYLVVRSTNSTLSSNPVNGTNYSANSSLGGGTVVTKTVLNSFTANNLNPGTNYYFFVFAVNENNCSGGPTYNTSSPLTNNAATVTVPACTTPGSQATNISLAASSTSINGYFTAAATSVDGYLVLYSTSSSLSNTPQDGTTYLTGTTLGNATVLANSKATSFIATGFTPATPYYFFVFTKKDECTGGPKYLTTSPLQGSVSTTALATFGYYFGNLHSHSSYSDGNKEGNGFTPAQNYNYAKSSMCMDYLGISEHNHSEAGMALSDYANGVNQAAAATTSTFVALYGMEWGVISNGGHTLVYGVDQLIGWEPGNYNIFVAKSDYTGTPPTTGTTGLFKTLNDLGGNAFAMLAHPDNSDYNNIANTSLRPTADSAIVGVAIESGPAFSTSTSYNDLPSSLSYYNYFKRLLSRGYHVGPSIDHDNHYTNFGRSSYSRLAIVSPALTANDLLSSVRSRRFYATLDCDMRVDFRLNNEMMGSITQGTTAPAISINVTDPTNPGATPTIRLMYGVPGNGINAIAIDSVTGNTFNYTDYNLAVGSTGYYYVEVSFGSGYVITSPIWYTRTTPVPVTMLSFKAVLNIDKTVNLQWTTTNEINSKNFIVERSLNGVNFSAIGSIAANNTAGSNEYLLTDRKPVEGLNYYRLKQVDKDGKFSYSTIVMVNLKIKNVHTVGIFPNPVQKNLNLKITALENAKGAIIITDALGNIVFTESTSFTKGTEHRQINTSVLAAGEYYVVVKVGEERIVQQFVKQ